ncbi:ATP-grasp domain-containing protein [Phaeobacter porticola]|uniref:Vancomycin C-type resistance protein VanC n=1 Tax=Phaeobacter porticola TaxID=1844006 RepID=A0A1L3IB66_9RHOB|nr:ATP-grasp domain-containing protein [Phaeobacter porticola]APG49410.1 Vancomycin C-type resistance protein VanC [Phaeobacter porticola]
MSEPKRNILMIGGRDHTFVRIGDMGLRYSALQIRAHLTDHLLDHAETVVVTDYEDIDSSVALAQALHRKTPFDAVFSFAEYGFLTAAHIAEVLNLPSNCQVSTVQLTRNKRLMREALRASGIKDVPFARVRSAAEIADFVAHHGECIIKPAEGGGSEGVYLVDATTDISRALAHAVQVGRDELIAEAFIPGPEYSVETMSVEGAHRILAVTEKTTSGAPYFIESGHVQPAALSADDAARIGERVRVLLDAVGYRTGPAHTEVKLNDGAVHVIETQTRNGGDQIWELTLETTGADVFKETFAAVLGLDYSAPPPAARAMAIRYMLAQDRVLDAITGLDCAARAEGVARVQSSAKPGTRYDAVLSAASRVAYVLARGDSREQALAHAEAAVAQIELR